MTAQQPEPPDPPPDLPELESEIDESEIRRELLNDVSERERRGVKGKEWFFLLSMVPSSSRLSS
jgi:hypothetical protein